MPIAIIFASPLTFLSFPFPLSAFLPSVPAAVIKVDINAWSFTSLTLASPFAYGRGILSYNGKLYITGGYNKGMAIVNEATFTETADSPFAFSSSCNGFNINNYLDYLYVACSNEPTGQSKEGVRALLFWWVLRSRPNPHPSILPSLLTQTMQLPSSRWAT